MKHFLSIAPAFATLAPGQSLRVMTFNVRYPNPKDGTDVWENRRDLLAATVRRHHPDVMGTQELFKLQGDFITATLLDYAWFGVSRRGNERDEAARLESARVVQEQLAKLGAKLPIMLTGDFNAWATGAVHERMLATGLIDFARDRQTQGRPGGDVPWFQGHAGPSTHRLDSSEPGE